MVLRKLTPTAAAALTAALILAACANDTSTAPASAATDDKSVLQQSLAGLKAGNYTFSRAGQSTASGTVHLPEGSLIERPYGPTVLRVADAFYMQYRIHGDGYESYEKLYDEHAAKATPKEAAEIAEAREIMGVLDGKHWIRADEERLMAAANEEDLSGMEEMPPVPTTAQPDVTGISALVGAVVSAESTGSSVTGTLDATKVDPKLGLFTNDPYYFYGPRAAAMPFKATLDDLRRITQITVTLPGMLEAAASQPPPAIPSNAPTEAPEPPLVISISQYGTTPVPAVPKDVTDLNPAAYEMLTNDVD